MDNTPQDVKATEPLIVLNTSQKANLGGVPSPQRKIDFTGFNSFFSLTGGSIFYCLSAATIIFGIMQNLAPALTQGQSLREAISCFLAINIYEIALLGVLVAIVCLRNVTDDAISLVLLVALFLVASGLILGTMAYHRPGVCLYIGVGAAIVAIVKILIMQRFIKFKIDGLAIAGLALIMFWNFLTTSLMAPFLVGKQASEEVRRGQWQMGWLVLLLGGVMVFVSAIRNKQAKHDSLVPLIYQPGMVWIFTLMVLVASYAHQYAIAYMFVIDHTIVDYIPLISVITLLVLLTIYHFSDLVLDLGLVIGAIPLVAVVCAVMSGMPFKSGFGIHSLWNPCVVLSLTALGIHYIACVSGEKKFYYLVYAYVLGALLTAGAWPMNADNLNWKLFGTVLFVSVVGLGIYYKNIALCFFAVLLLAMGLGMSDTFAKYESAIGLTASGAFFGILGFGTLTITIIFGKVEKILPFIGSIAAMICLFDYVADVSVTKVILASVVALAFVVGLYLRSKVILPALLLLLPSATKFYVLTGQLSSWRWVILSFVLLAVGAVASFRKGAKNMASTSNAAVEETQL